jgi:hypothetical protein
LRQSKVTHSTTIAEVSPQIKSSKRQVKVPLHLRIKVIGCGAVARWRIRPLIAHLRGHVDATFEIALIDGKGHEAQRLTSETSSESPLVKITVAPVYVVAGNIDSYIQDGDYVFVSVNNTATVKLISDHTMTLQNVTALNGFCIWYDGVVQIHVRRSTINLTPPFANQAHSEYVNPTFPW